MKKFHFSLQKLLDYKEQIFDTERAVLADMTAALHRMEQEREDLEEQHRVRTAELRQRTATGLSALELETHKVYLGMLDESIRQKQAQIQLQKKAVEKQADKVREAKIEISTMEKLKERKQEEYNHAASKAEELFIEEFVQSARVTAPAV